MFSNQYDLYNYELELEKLFMISNVLLNEYLSGTLILNYIRDKDNPWTKDLIIALDPTGELQRREYVPSLEQLDSLSEEEAKKYIVSYEGFLGKIFQAIINFFKAIGRFIGKLFKFNKKSDYKLKHISDSLEKQLKSMAIKINSVTIDDKDKAIKILDEIIELFSDKIKVPEFFLQTAMDDKFHFFYHNLTELVRIDYQCNELYEMFTPIEQLFQDLLKSLKEIAEKLRYRTLDINVLDNIVMNYAFSCSDGKGKYSNNKEELLTHIRRYCVIIKTKILHICSSNSNLSQLISSYIDESKVLQMIQTNSYQQNDVHKKIEEYLINPTKDVKLDILLFGESLKDQPADDLVSIVRSFEEILRNIIEVNKEIINELKVSDKSIDQRNKRIIECVKDIEKSISEIQSIINSDERIDDELKKSINMYTDVVIQRVNDFHKFSKFILYELTFYVKLMIKLKDLISNYCNTIYNKFDSVTDILQKHLSTNNIQET